MTKIVTNGKLTNLLGNKYEIIVHEHLNGQYNMDFDMERTSLCAENKAIPMFRLYGWKPWAVSLGANQKESDINIEAVRNAEYDLVRRPTGGRAVLHADEITYSVVTHLSNNLSKNDIYREIHKILVAAFETLGCSLDFEKVGTDFRSWYKENGFNVSCFASSARYEVEWNGKKIVGSAQRLFGNTLLQHGSILLGKGYEQLAYMSNNLDDEGKKRLLKFTEEHSATLSDACGRKISYQETADAILKIID